MKALYWDGRELCLRPTYPTPDTFKFEKRESKTVVATERRSDSHDNQVALVKVHLAGICSTDLQIFKGYMDFRGVPGHEFVGSVIEGPETVMGKRVVGEINFACGRCQFCRRDLSRHCPHRSVMGILNADGAFGELVAIPVANLHVVGESVTDEEAVFTEPLAAAFEILEQAQVNLGDEVLILGDGKLSFLCAQVLRLASANVSLVGKHSDKLKLIKQFGIKTMLLSAWQPRLFDVVVEATGSASGLELAMSTVRPRGTLVLKTTIAGAHKVSLAPLVINEITTVGSRCGPFAPALDALQQRTVSVTPVIEKIYPLREGIQAVAHAGKPGTRKILLRP